MANLTTSANLETNHTFLTYPPGGVLAQRWVAQNLQLQPKLLSHAYTETTPLFTPQQLAQLTQWMSQLAQQNKGSDIDEELKHFFRYDDL